MAFVCAVPRVDVLSDVTWDSHCVQIAQLGPDESQDQLSLRVSKLT